MKCCRCLSIFIFGSFPSVGLLEATAVDEDEHDAKEREDIESRLQSRLKATIPQAEIQEETFWTRRRIGLLIAIVLLLVGGDNHSHRY